MTVRAIIRRTCRKALRDTTVKMKTDGSSQRMLCFALRYAALRYVALRCVTLTVKFSTWKGPSLLCKIPAEGHQAEVVQIIAELYLTKFLQRL